MADENEDIISLEDLVRDAPADSTSEQPPPPADPHAVPATAPPPLNDGVDVDQLLAIEDPQFAASMKELQKQGAHGPGSAEVDIDSLDIEKLSKEQNSKFRRAIHFVLRPYNFLFGSSGSIGSKLGHLAVKSVPQAKVLAKSSVESSLHFIKAVLKELKSWLAGFKALPRKSKLVALLAATFGVFAIFILKTTLSGRISLHMGPQFLHSFEEVADAKYEIEKDEPFEDFTDPLLHPEHVVEIEKMVVNLRGGGGESNPMGLFAFYFEASNQECAVELKDREAEARDLIGRTLEQMTYEELSTVEGKEKAKISLRKSLNGFLTKGQVRHVFFKNVVLKP